MQSVTCLATDACLTADPGVTSLTRTWSHTFVEMDHEITAILLPSHSRKAGVCYKRKFVHEVLVNPLFKLAQEKSVVRLTDRPDMNITVYWDVKQQTHCATKHEVKVVRIVDLFIHVYVSTY